MDDQQVAVLQWNRNDLQLTTPLIVRQNSNLPSDITVGAPAFVITARALARPTR